MKIHHVAFRTRDLERLERFYVDVLELRLLERKGDRAVWLAIGDAILMLERADEGEPTVPKGSMEFLAFDIAPHARVGYLARLGEAGVAIEAESDFTIYFRDPDGRRIGLSHHPGVSWSRK
jgi:catechol 2,3-dioxygenase-like lactoylglutathione lyase family enzyme